MIRTFLDDFRKHIEGGEHALQMEIRSYCDAILEQEPNFEDDYGKWALQYAAVYLMARADAEGMEV